MATHTLIDMNNKEAGKVELADDVFGIKPKKHLIKDVVVMQLASKRSGNAETKTRSDVRGGGAKPFRQKGTGNARQGTSRSPINEGGGVVFGPHKRDYSFKIPKKVRKIALKTALIQKKEESRLFVLEKIEFAQPKTKHAIEFLKKLNTKSALVVESDNKNLELAFRNIPKIKLIKPEGVNVYDVVRYESLIMTKSSMKKVEEKLK